MLKIDSKPLGKIFGQLMDNLEKTEKTCWQLLENLEKINLEKIYRQFKGNLEKIYTLASLIAEGVR